MRRGMQWTVVSLVAIGALAGGWVSAWIFAGTVNSLGGGIGPGPWRTAKGTGDVTAGFIQRAIVARQGLWALPQTEVVYFTATTDDQGGTLSNRCTYEIAQQQDPQTRWWSVTLYRNLFWVDNPLDRYSWASTNLTREYDGSYRITLSAKSAPGNWLPMGDEEGGFLLIFRNYQPDPSIAADPEATPLPTIRKTSCN